MTKSTFDDIDRPDTIRNQKYIPRGCFASNEEWVVNVQVAVSASHGNVPGVQSSRDPCVQSSRNPGVQSSKTPGAQSYKAPRIRGPAWVHTKPHQTAHKGRSNVVQSSRETTCRAEQTKLDLSLPPSVVLYMSEAQRIQHEVAGRAPGSKQSAIFDPRSST